MSQGIWGTINPNVTSGTQLAILLNAFKNAFVSGNSGTLRPPNLQSGGLWVDVTNLGSPNFYFQVKLYTGTVDIEVFRVNVNSNFGGPTTADSELDITQISADTTGAIMGLIKQRILNDGQVLDGDVIGEIQFVGCTPTPTNPLVAVMRWTASDDETDSELGGFLSLQSTPDASSTITEHIRFISGVMETKTALRQNSLVLVGQNVATTAAIVQLSATKILVEMTGATATDIQGINSGQATQEIIVHNRSTANVTLKHQNATAAAADRLKLATASDYVITPDNTCALYYCTTDARWKIKSTSRFVANRTTKPVRGLMTDWTCPTGVSRVLVTPYKRKQLMSPNHATSIDLYGNLSTWGSSLAGGLGDGTQVAKSSPVAIGTISRFSDGHYRNYILTQDTSYGLDKAGNAYAWGQNSNGQLGVGDVVARSTPTAVIGGKKFLWLWDGAIWCMGGGIDGITYAWGKTPIGTLGTSATIVSSPVAVFSGINFDYLDNTSAVGAGEAIGGIDVNGNAYVWGGSNTSFAQGGSGTGSTATSVSSPSAVLGGLTFKKLSLGVANSNVWALGLTKTGALYAWGSNSAGNLGVGDTVSRSSPVAVVGGLFFQDIFTGGSSNSSSVTYDSAFGLADDGTLYAWGANLNGQLGVGDVNARSSPVAVLGGLKFKDILVGLGTAGVDAPSILGITINGDMYGWGLNTAGQLGVGDVIPRSSPVAVLGGIKWAQFAHRELKGSSTILAVSQEGVIYSWGGPTAEQGIGALTAQSSPVAVLGGITFDPRIDLEAIAINVTAGSTYRIILPHGKQATFASTNLGFDIERISIEYDKQGD